MRRCRTFIGSPVSSTSSVRLQRARSGTTWSAGFSGGRCGRPPSGGALPRRDARPDAPSSSARSSSSALPTGRAQATTTTVLGALLALDGRVRRPGRCSPISPLAVRGDRQRGRSADDVDAVLRRGGGARRGSQLATRQLLARASSDSLATGDVAHASSHAVLLAYVLLDVGDDDRRPTSTSAMAEEQALSVRRLRAVLVARRARARLARDRGRASEAEELARDAVRIASLTDALRERARVHFALADVLQLSGKTKEARAEMTAARRLLRQKGASALLDRCVTPTLARP